MTFNIGGDPACLSGPLDDFPVYEIEKEGTNGTCSWWYIDLTEPLFLGIPKVCCKGKKSFATKLNLSNFKDSQDTLKIGTEMVHAWVKL